MMIIHSLKGDGGGNPKQKKKATADTLKEVALSEELYRIGLTKVLFKAGEHSHIRKE